MINLLIVVVIAREQKEYVYLNYLYMESIDYYTN